MMHTLQATLVAGVALLAVAGLSLGQTASGPSTQTLLTAQTDSANWVPPARSYSGRTGRLLPDREVSS